MKASTFLSLIGGCRGLLTILFVILKLTGVITFSWWLVFAPVWFPFGFGLVIHFLSGLAFYLFIRLVEKYW